MLRVSYLIKANQPSFRHRSILISIRLPCILHYLRYGLTRRQTRADSPQLWSSLDTRSVSKEKGEEVCDGPHDQSPCKQPRRLSPVRTGVGTGSQWEAGFLRSPKPQCLPHLCRSTKSSLPGRWLKPPQQLPPLLFVQAMWI